MFTSTFSYRGKTEFTEFSSTRIMMMPIIIGNLESIPAIIGHYKKTIADIFKMTDHKDCVGYLTIDEKHLNKGETTRRSGIHVDGVYQGKTGAWGGGGSWGSTGNGMLTVSSYPACRAWNQDVEGFPGNEGECDHLADCLLDSAKKVFEKDDVYWLDGLCIHESMPVDQEIDRQFLRLSLPSNGPWFKGYTENPLGVQPTGPILPAREFM